MAEIKKVLVIDDELFVCKSVKKILATESIETEISTIGREGLVKARTCSYDMVMVDIQMPEMNGYAVVRMIREIHPDMPIIVISGYNTPHTKEQAFKNGASDFIPKPFLPEEVLEKVKLFYSGDVPRVVPVSDQEKTGGVVTESSKGRDSGLGVGYTCSYAGGEATVSISASKAAIEEFAAGNELSIKSFYEDSDSNVSPVKRPAVREILNNEREIGTVVIDTVWCISKNRKVLREFLEIMDAEGIKLVVVNDSMMDCASQFVRRWYRDRDEALKMAWDESEVMCGIKNIDKTEPVEEKN
ncbi:MAG TPA: response regulator [bacterium]|nr:response regulator [bacterium]